MNEQIKIVEDIFHAASELRTAKERERYLNQVCGGNVELRQEVEQLLAAVPLGDAFFQSCEQSGRAYSEPTLEPAAEQPGSVIGPYRLLQRIGEGGMGVVYLAEQDQPIRRKVALKVIKLGMDTRQVVARFEVERQALAMMDHPHIARVLDAGATKMGRPYFAMELVQGVPITEFCEANQLSVEERLELFIPVCQAIQSAHQKGVIHRDIKPSNVLVTMHNGAALPMVIDFGVAKAVDQKFTEKTLFTNFAMMIGTPAYMSPEQAEMSKLDVDTRSDIYSLGALLYELLTGSPPFPEARLRSVAFGEMQRIIAGEEPERPSTRLRKGNPRQGRIGTPKPQIDSDLDAVVLKCLEKDRSRRYETANDLSTDLSAYLHHTPVKARPPSGAYRLRKFVRRNRVASTATALVALAVLGGGFVAGWSLSRERVANRHADEGLRAALAFADQVFAQVAPEIQNLPGAATAQAKLGEVGLTFLQRLQSNASDDSRMRAALARLFISLSNAQSPGEGNPTGNYETGLRYAREAVELLSTISVALADADRLYLLAWAKRNVDKALYSLGRTEEALAHVAEMELLYDEIQRTPEYAREARRHRQSVRLSAGYYLLLAGDPARALNEYLLPILQTAWARNITTNSLDYEIETVMNVNGNAALAYAFLGDAQAALPFSLESVRWADFLYQQFPNDARWESSRAAYHSRHGYVQIATGSVSEGFAALDRGRQWAEDLATLDPANDRFRATRVLVLVLQAMAFAKWSEATDAPVPDREQRLAQAHACLLEAELRHREAKAKESELYFRKAQSSVFAAAARLSIDHPGQPAN